jgi:hypothetical protein
VSPPRHFSGCVHRLTIERKATLKMKPTFLEENGKAKFVVFSMREEMKVRVTFSFLRVTFSFLV